MRRVSRTEPCPICNRPDWCGVSEDGGLCICMREAQGSIGTARNGGYLHRIAIDPGRSTTPWVRSVQIPIPAVDPAYNAMQQQFCRDLDPSRLGWLAGNLGLSTNALRRLGIGWNMEKTVYTFPMRDHEGVIRGFRLRAIDGQKFALKGGHDGLFVPTSLTGMGPLLITEGPSDCAAALDLGYDAIGRPSCLGAIWYTVEFIRQRWPVNVVIVGDADGPGRDGAEKLAHDIVGISKTLKVIYPPDGVKDLRAWKNAGATVDHVQIAIDETETRQISWGNN